MRGFFLPALGVIFLLGSSAWAKQEGSALKKVARQKVPVVITARQAEFNNKERKAVYKGSVKVVRGKSIMYSDQLEAFWDRDGKQLDHIVATGNVVVLQEGKKITAEKGVYYEAQQKVVLTGNPVSREGENMVKGSRMTYFFNEERVVVENAVSELHPARKKKDKQAVGGSGEKAAAAGEAE